MSFDGAYTDKMSIVLMSGIDIVKKSVSLSSLQLTFVIVHPLFFLRKTRMPLLLDGLP